MRGSVWCLVLGVVGCSGGDGNTVKGTFVDPTGELVELRGGFVGHYHDGETWREELVLTSFEDSCEAMTWWVHRNEQLTDLFFTRDENPTAFDEALRNTQEAFAQELGGDHAFFMTVDWVDEEAQDFASAAGPNDHWSNGGTFWSWAEALHPPELQDLSETSSSLASVHYEATAIRGDLEIKLNETLGGEGTLQATLETDSLALFDVDVRFDVPLCGDYVQAWTANVSWQ